MPAVVRWPSEIEAETESDALLHAVDLFPTFAGLAGASTTDGLPLDGLDAWEAVAHSEESPRTELVHSPHVLRQGDWKLIERIAHTSKWASGKLWLFNIAEDPYETTNLAETETAKVSEMEARLDYFAQFARANDSGRQVSLSSPTVFGEEENEAFGTAVRAALTARDAGNTGPSPVRLETVGNQVKLSFDEPLDADAVPPASAFAVVVNPGYNTAEVEAVDVGGHAVLLSLAQAPAATDTVGLTYNVPDTGAIRDLDDLEAAGVTWVTGTVTSAFLSGDAALRRSESVRHRLRDLLEHRWLLQRGGRKRHLNDYGDGHREPFGGVGVDHAGQRGEPLGGGQRNHRPGHRGGRADNQDLHGDRDAGGGFGRCDAERSEPVRHRPRHLLEHRDFVHGRGRKRGRDHHRDGNGSPFGRVGVDRAGQRSEPLGGVQRDHRHGHRGGWADHQDLYGDGNSSGAARRVDRSSSQAPCSRASRRSFR